MSRNGLSLKLSFCPQILEISSSKGRHPNEKTFQFGHCPNYPKKNLPHPPIWATLPTFSSRQKRRFARMVEKNTDDDNNCCHDNFDQNFGNFDDNYDKKY